MHFNFLKLLNRISLHLLSQAVRENVVSDDVTITSSLRSDVIILGANFPFLSKVSLQDGLCQKLRNCVYIDEVIQSGLFPDTV